ncbi:hypothetical protein MHZ92_11135 [Sporosarcina sp. ACRSL]|uniref:hypothetical protein n=1 Tax=Sporosarcina sp. ACRSL TaxID=2918215 RepID=UPI001EF6F8C8|nr:hypothetical protein [Sporosarcina sp. ACRSL]MCG7344693.1 hypothetical protein [Sporosarcina sp. ACRSL]
MKKLLLTSTVIIFGFSIYKVTSSTDFVEENAVEDAEKVNDVTDVTYQSVDPDHEWIIEFDKGINETLLNTESLYVKDDKNNLVAVSIQRDNNTTVRILPPEEGYDQETVYTLNINKNLDLENLGKYNPQEAHKRNFKVEDNT